MTRPADKIGILVLLVLVVAYLFVLASFLDGTFILQAFLFWGSNIAITTLLVGPFVWRGKRKQPGEKVPCSSRLLALAALVLLAELLLLLSGHHLNFFNLEWNWIGKLNSLSIAVVFVVLWSGLTWQVIGVAAPRQGSWLRVFNILAGVFAVYILAAIFTGEQSIINVETILFQATMPGLEEELVFRGILWVLVARALPGSRRLWGADVGWNIVITTLLFATMHGVTFNDNLNIVFDPAVYIFTGVYGFLLGWIRAYSGSIIPAIVLHNGVNLLSVLIPWLV